MQDYLLHPLFCQKSMLALPHAANIALIKSLVHALYVYALSAFFRVDEITKTGSLISNILLGQYSFKSVGTLNIPYSVRLEPYNILCSSKSIVVA